MTRGSPKDVMRLEAGSENLAIRADRASRFFLSAGILVPRQARAAAYGDATRAGGALPRPIKRAATSPTTIAVRLVLCITLSG